MDTDVKIIILAVVGFVAFVVIAIHVQMSQPCDDFKNISLQNVPARCLSYYGIAPVQVVAP